MKTLEQVKTEQKFGNVFTLNEFAELYHEGYIIEYDGNGYFHDGEHRTNISVWDSSLTWKDIQKFPYVCWYNK